MDSPSFIRAAAVDYDGTIAAGGTVSADALAAIGEARTAGCRVILVTGRILSELRADFPGVETHFDAIVGENGAVLWTPARGERPLHEPVLGALADALAARGIPLRRGEVLLAIDGVHEPAVFEETRRLGLESQLVRNREALMVLPPGASKGHGLYVALGVLGISHHNAIGFGDAENDHSLLEACEVGIAVGNAVPALIAHADVVLSEPDGAGVARLLRESVVRATRRLPTARWHIDIGRTREGLPVTIPAAQTNLLIAGETATGKSWLAGLLAERLIEADYSVCILDPEGDHPGLGRLRGVSMVGGPGGVPSVGEIRRVLQHRFGSAVVDASALSFEEKRAFYIAALGQVDEQRRENGLPHWVFLDEAQLPAGDELVRFERGLVAGKGFCLVTWRPDELAATVRDGIDLVLITREHSLSWLPARFDRAEAEAALAKLFPGESLLLAPGPGGTRIFRGLARSVPHVRHWHKYVTTRLPEHRRFHFVAGPHGPRLGYAAGNLAEFHREVQRAPASSILHHATQRDFSRWIADVVNDAELAATLREIEVRWPPDAAAAEAIRAATLEAIRGRYLDEGGGAHPLPGR